MTKSKGREGRVGGYFIKCLSHFQQTFFVVLGGEASAFFYITGKFPPKKGLGQILGRWVFEADVTRGGRGRAGRGNLFDYLREG